MKHALCKAMEDNRGEVDKVDKNNRTSKLGYRSAGNRSKANDFWPY